MRRLLKANGIEVETIYTSSDHAATKFSGRLFELVARSEGVKLGEIDHRGDSWLADVLSPAALGVRVTRMKPPGRGPGIDPLPPAPPSPAETDDESVFGVGYRTLGPVLVAFARLLLARSCAEGVTHLAFVSRDGDLLLEIVRTLLAKAPPSDDLQCSYVHFSRRSVSDAASHGLVLGYLRQEGLLDERCAIVDVGWRGSTHRIIRDIAAAAGEPSQRAYYLGYWDDDAVPPVDHSVLGLVGDQRRGRTLREGAPWHAALIIETVCRAQHGTVLGYSVGEDGRVAPVHQRAGETRAAEGASRKAQAEARSGVLAYARWFADTLGAIPPDEEPVRRAAQSRLLALAFFPSPAERRLGRRLIHTEVEGEFFATLIQPRGRGLRGWLTGLRSPWKGGYLQQNGGRALASAYWCFEWALNKLPPGLKTELQRRLGPQPGDRDFQRAAARSAKS
jgi:hypothetical protein